MTLFNDCANKFGVVTKVQFSIVAHYVQLRNMQNDNLALLLLTGVKALT